MGKDAILDCVASLKVKNAEGYDRIPRRIIKDCINHLIVPLTMFFKLLYETKEIPDQWKIVKVIPIPKKGSKIELSNYWPINPLLNVKNLWKINFQKSYKLETSLLVDLTGDQQHSFFLKAQHPLVLFFNLS